MQIVTRKLTEQQQIALKKVHWECIMRKNNLVFMMSQHNKDADDSWLESEQFQKLLGEYEDSFVTETLFKQGLVDLILRGHVANAVYDYGEEGCVKIILPDEYNVVSVPEIEEYYVENSQ